MFRSVNLNTMLLFNNYTRAFYITKKNCRSVFNLAKAAKTIKTSGNESLKLSPSAQKYTITKHFQHPQSLIYQLISRVDLYHEFIPYCTSSFVKERDSITNEPSIAGLRVGFQNFDEEFTCNLACNKPEIVVAKSITHSLFYFLETEWKIVANDKDNCVAVLNLSYEFKSKLYNHVSSLFAKKVASLMTDAFEKRALEVYTDESKLLEYNDIN